MKKPIKERELKRSCVSLSMRLPRAYEDLYEPGALGGVERFAKAHQLTNPSGATDSPICVESYVTQTPTDSFPYKTHPGV